MGPQRNREPAVALRPVVDPANWRPDDLAKTDDWILRLTADEVVELHAAVDRVHRERVDLTQIRREDFPLPRLGPRLDAAREEVLWGRGVMHLRGLRVDRLDRWQSIAMLCGMGTYLGDAVSQNHKGHLLGHVRSLSKTGMEVSTNRGYNITGDSIAFHCDSADIVGLLCLTEAKSGGETKFTSSIAIYNELLERRPDLAAELTKPFYRDRREEIPVGKGPYYPMPVFSFFEGYLTVNYQGTYIRSAQRFEELPRFTSIQTEALQSFADLAEELCMKMPFEAGDLQFLNNHVTVHSRTAYEDYEDDARKRHLLRLWLATPNGRPLPPAFGEKSYAPVSEGARPMPGVVVAGMTRKVPLEPE